MIDRDTTKRMFTHMINMMEQHDTMTISCGDPLMELLKDVRELLKEKEAVVHPEPSCEMTYITDCCCDLCGVQLIREDNFCRCCGKPILWEGR